MSNWILLAILYLVNLLFLKDIYVRNYMLSYWMAVICTYSLRNDTSFNQQVIKTVMFINNPLKDMAKK